jgi:HK97 family phage prohead protease
MDIQYPRHGAMPGTCDAAQGPEADTTKHFPLPSVGADAVIHSPVCTAVVKADDSGRLSGLAWSFSATPDAVGDVLLPSALEAAAKSLPVPILVEHQGPEVGMVERASVTAEGLVIAGRVDTASPAYAEAKSGRLAGLSIAFTGEAERSGPVRIFKSCTLHEISLCARPVNAGAAVRELKSWQELTTEAELVKLLKSATGMPGRLAQKIASAAWPYIQHRTDEPDPALIAALRRLARI